MELIKILFKPYSSKDDTRASVIMPLVFLMCFATISAFPTFQVGKTLTAVSYAIISFFVLCFLRLIVLELGWHRSIPPSFIGVAEAEAIIFPSLFWIMISFFLAYKVWGWEIIIQQMK